MERICRIDNLYEAFLRAAKGKNGHKVVVEFRERLNCELESIMNDLSTGSYRCGEGNLFTIYDPKKRQIKAAPFRDRVTFHAVMRVCHSVFDKYQIFDSYASRPGKGTYAALERAQMFVRRYGWFAKLDVVKYFDTIDHDVLRRQLCRLFKDAGLLRFFDELIAGYCTLPGKGLPIGNLTSQYFANHYLSPADHYAKEVVGVPAVVRYMDDMLLFADDKNELMAYCRTYSRYVSEVLKLELHPVTMNRTASGLPFLGYVVYPHKLRLNENSKRRFRSKLIAMEKARETGSLGETEYVARVQSMYSFVEKADSIGFRKRTLEIMEQSSQSLALTGSTGAAVGTTRPGTAV